MNNLSKLIYFGGVAGNFGIAFFFLGLFCLIATGTYISYFIVMKSDGINSVQNLDSWRTAGLKESIKDVEDKLSEVLKISRWPISALGFLTAFFWLAAALMPGKDTVYAIAASQVGEQVLTTPLAAKAEKAIEGWLDKQVAPQ